jgi:DNA-binding transcriptional ArsR family regulator
MQLDSLTTFFPDHDLPAFYAAARRRLDDLFEALQNPTRVMVIRFVLAHPSATRQDVVDGTGAAVAPVYRALAALERAGYLSADATRGERSGRTVHYSADRVRLSTDAGALFGWLVS